jgi:peptidoglycan/xylan/chitin deacetylase (PgdA/CDA1 family)
MKRLAALIIVLTVCAACAGQAPHDSSPARPSSSLNPSLTPVPITSPTPAPTPTSGWVGDQPAPTQPSPHDSGNALPASLIGTEWTTLPTSKKVVALTFDAGANNAGVASILQTLRSTNVPATFFFTGTWTEIYPDQAQEIASRYPVGNHTYSHPYLTQLLDDEVSSEITRAGTLIRSATGDDDRPLFRFPYGASDARTIGIANDLGYGGIRWTVDTVGWKGTSGGETVDRVVQRVLDALRPGCIVLMHVGSHPEDGSTLDADSLPRIISELRDRGYRFVTIPEYL